MSAPARTAASPTATTASATPAGATSAAAKATLALLLGLLLALGATRALLMAASGVGLQIDEAQYWHWSRELHWGYYSKPPVIAALIAASTALFGDTVLGVKALCMLLWLLIALLVYGFTRELVQDALADITHARALAAEAEGHGLDASGHAVAPPAALPPLVGTQGLAERAGFWAALLFTTTPVAGVLGMAASTDAPLLFCWVLATRLLWRALRQRRAFTWAALGLVIGVGLLSKYTLAAWLPGAVALVLLRRWWPRWGRGGAEAVHPALRPHDPSAFGPRLASATVSGTATLGRPQQQRLRPLHGLVLALGVCLVLLLPHIAWNAAWGWPTLHHTADITAHAQRAGDDGAAGSLGEFIAGQVLQIGPVLGTWLLLIAALGLGRLWQDGRGDRHPEGAPLAGADAAPARAAPAWRNADEHGARGQGADRQGAERDAPDAATLALLGQALAPVRRHLLWLLLPLLLAATAQALNARAQVNWTAPAVPLLCAWLGLHVVIAGPAPQRRRRRIALAAVLSSLALTLFAAAAPTLARALGQPWPARADLYVRMRGWPEAYAALRPQLQAHPGWRVVGVNRTVIAHGAWAWRDLPVRFLAWREPGPPIDHYQLTLAWDRALRAGAPAEPVFVLSEGGELPATLVQKLGPVERLQRVDISTAPGRVLSLQLWQARLPAAARP